MTVERWLSREELARITGWHFDVITRKRKKRELLARQVGKSRNGRQLFEYSALSLPAEYQIKFVSTLLAEPAQRGTVQGQAAQCEREVSPQPCCVPPQKEEELKRAMSLIQPLIDHSHGQSVLLLDGHTAETFTDIVRDIAARNRLSLSSIWRYWTVYKSGRFTELVTKPRSDRGRSRYFREHPLAAEFVRHKYLNENLSAQMCWEALLRDREKVCRKDEPPSYSTVALFVRTIPKPVQVLAREGKQAYERKCSPYVQRAPVDAMAWWISDHRQFDVMVRNTLFAELRPDEPYRVWFTAIMDWGSRKIVGWCFAPSPSSRTISSALRVAALDYGFPKNFYWDNGKDYQKVREQLEQITLSPEAAAVLDREGVTRVDVTSALPFHPRSKPIEAHFTHWSKRFDVLWRSSYLGNKPGNCPEAARTAQALHQKYLKGKRAASPLPTDAEFILAAIQAIDDYNDKPHRSLQHRTPNEVMEEQYPERHRRSANPRLLDVLFGERTLRVVRQGGCVQLDNMLYEPDDASLFAMDLRKGQSVMVLRDPYNLGEATAADPETLQYVGSLRIQELVAQAPGGRITRDQIQAGMRKQRALRRGYGEYLAALGAFAASLDWRTEREELMARATGTDGQFHVATPGATRARLPLQAKRATQPAFISDAVEQDRDIFREVKLEE